MTHEIKIQAALDPDVYFSVTDLVDPFTVSIPLGISNNEAIQLWFTVEWVGAPAGWIVTSEQLGSIVASSSDIFIFDPTRNMPVLTAGEFDDTLTLRIKAYSDAYITLYGQKDFLVTIHFFDHEDVAWTLIDHDNFDGGTFEGWASKTETCIDVDFSPTCSMAGYATLDSTHFISAPDSMKVSGNTTTEQNMRKLFAVGVYTKARIVIHFRKADSFAVKVGDDLIIPNGIAKELPDNIWIRIAYDFPVDASTYVRFCSSANDIYYIDEIWVIAK